MARTDSWRPLAPDLFLFVDSCNVYLLRSGDRGTVVDFGTGAWLDRLGEIGVERLEQVVLTHVHRDQLCGLYRGSAVDCPVHAPAGGAHLLTSDNLHSFWRNYQENGCPASYAAPRQPLAMLQPDMAADTEVMLGEARFCCIATPGHTQGALTYLVAWRGHHLALCGDAVHAGGKIHQPYHLEWDHWTPGGGLAAWHGLERLNYCHFDLLLPAHGPIVERRARACVAQAQKRLMDLVRAKGSVCAGERNRWCDLEEMECGAFRVLPHLYQFGANSFLLLSEAGQGLVVDLQLADIERLAPLMEEVGLERIDVATASHYHMDHSDGLNLLRARYGARVWLHPLVAEPIVDRDRLDVPWLPAESIEADRLLPADGSFRWGEYRFTSHSFPGQTRWHAAFDTRVDGCHVLFSGDNYQPPSRWNGTGGFCSFNGSRFGTGFAVSAQKVLDIAPEIVCNGHGCVYRFAPSHFRRILRWAERTERTVAALCPSENWLADYDCRAVRWEPFVSRVKPGKRLELSLIFANHGSSEVALIAAPVGPGGWKFSHASRRMRVEADKERRMKFGVELPRRVAPGRYLVAADIDAGGRLQAEACAAIVDVG